MELRQLRYLVAIAEHGSFSKAAEKVFVAQSALSQQIALLEAEVGTPLFDRSRKGAQLSEAGQRFLPHAVSILRQVQEAARSARQDGSAPEGKVVFGLPHSVSNALALPLLRAVRARWPGVQLELTEELTGHLTRQLRSGHLHMAVLFDDGHLAGLRQARLLYERLSLIAPASCGNNGDGTRSISLRQALQQPLMLPAQPHGVRPLIEAAARHAGLPPPVVEADISSISILRTTLLAGMGRTLLPPMPLRAEIESGQLIARPVVRPALERLLVLCAPTDLPASAAAQAVWDLTLALTAQMCQHGEWLDARAAQGGVRPA